MKYLVLDFETVDPYIKLGLGAGWVYALQKDIPNPLFKVIGYSYCHIYTGIHAEEFFAKSGVPTIPRYSNILSENIIKGCNAIIMHNAQYDLGCLKVLGLDIKDLKVYDTKIIAQLYDNNLDSYSLDYLSKRYLPESQQKGINILINSAINCHFVDHLMPKRGPIPTNADECSPTTYKKIKDWCYSHMDVIQEHDFEAMSKYGCLDVVATANLFKLFCDVKETHPTFNGGML